MVAQQPVRAQHSSKKAYAPFLCGASAEDEGTRGAGRLLLLLLLLLFMHATRVKLLHGHNRLCCRSFGV